MHTPTNPRLFRLLMAFGAISVLLVVFVGTTGGRHRHSQFRRLISPRVLLFPMFARGPGSGCMLPQIASPRIPPLSGGHEIKPSAAFKVTLSRIRCHAGGAPCLLDSEEQAYTS